MASAIHAQALADCDRDRDGALRQASPIHAVGEMSPTPVLLVHGAEDDRVHPSVSLDFSGRLIEAGHPHGPGDRCPRSPRAACSSALSR